ncbi:MAG TPA: hypothetical protein VGP36_03200 [Mycobacteriales bacterium]|nr:hypothetical protein [Mycobacteriales bacterium]
MDPFERLADATRRLAELTRDRARTGRTHQDADDETGTVATDGALAFDPVPLLRALDSAGARVCVIGQVAGILHGSAELTGDLDLLWDGDPGAAPALAAGFAAAGVTLTDDDGTPVGPGGLARPKVLFTGPTATGDCCTPALPWGDLPVTAYLDRCEVATGPDLTLRWLRLEDLIAMRRAVGRPKDRRRAAELAALRGEP